MLSESRQTIEKLKEKVTKIEQECDKLARELEDQHEKFGPILKNGNRYSDAVVTCIKQLIGKIGISLSRCSPAIQCVGKCLFDWNIDLADLPSDRSVMRFADRGNVPAECHLTDTMFRSDGFDLHTDGTSRDHRKYVGNQATLSSGEVLSMGYTLVDTETLLDVATNLLRELADVYDVENAEETFQSVLHKLMDLMSDRASVLKSFNSAMEVNRRELLGDDAVQMQFLYCNAHFLLGLSSESEKVLRGLDRTLGKLGRDCKSNFSGFASAGENSASKYIRTCFDVIGPRGDEKNGCREAWEVPYREF
ncbi:hypothetical protein SNE40_016558 [Patella caerulea]|uniref:Uncharacterized protein n=1 Tax=Patella caerulea TaxID=87958 RepID=A0AAN8JEH5_PATCE